MTPRDGRAGGEPRVPAGHALARGCPRSAVGLGVARPRAARWSLGAARPRQRLFAAWLVAFLFFLTHRARLPVLRPDPLRDARRGWGVVVRRVAENATATLPLFALLFVPIALGLHALYHWSRSRGGGARRAAALEAALPERALLPARAPRLLRGRGRRSRSGSRGCRGGRTQTGDPAHRRAPAALQRRAPDPARAHHHLRRLRLADVARRRTGTRRSSASTSSPARFVAGFALLAIVGGGACAARARCAA